MTSSEREQMRARRWVQYRRRVREKRDHYGMKWDRAATNELTDRCAYIAGIDELDMTVLVRLFNRELQGRVKDND